LKISILVEGATERAFKPFLVNYLRTRIANNRMPRLDFVPYDGRIPKECKLERTVSHLLSGPKAADYVIALTDVYTGTTPPDFIDGIDAKTKMTSWVGPEDRFFPHVAQHDFEAWLLPYWPTIQRLADHNRNGPRGNPENVNHGHPPAKRVGEIFEIGRCRDSYVKPRDAYRILSENDLAVSIGQCSELKAFVNTIIRLCGGDLVP